MHQLYRTSFEYYYCYGGWVFSIRKFLTCYRVAVYYQQPSEQFIEMANQEADVGETLKCAALRTGAGAVIGGVAVAGAFLAVGLTFGGPIAGGWFAMNMGAGLVAGSPMALVQSAAMTTGAYYAGAGVGGAVGGLTAFFGPGAQKAPEPNEPNETDQPILDPSAEDGEQSQNEDAGLD